MPCLRARSHPARMPFLAGTVLLLAVAWSLMLTLAPTARSAETYARTTLAFSGWASGQFDESGTVYVGNGTKIKRVTSAGVALADITTPYAARGVAPSP